MRSISIFLGGIFALATGQACAATSPYALVKSGYSLTQADADQIEKRLTKKPNDEPAHLELLGYYATLQFSDISPAVRQKRADHIFWLIEHDPRCELFQDAGGAWKIFLKGDAFADPDAFEMGKQLWRKQIDSHPNDERIKQYAATFLQLGDPESAERLLREVHLNRAIGSLYAMQFLGIVALDDKTGNPAFVDETRRESDFSKRALAELRSTGDAQLIGGAGFWLAVEGGMLYADGKTSWDYTTLSEEFLAKARRLDPATLDWYAVPNSLPARGDRPPRVFRIGAGLKSSFIRGTKPVYPDAARAQGLEGTVLIDVLVGLDGKVVKAVVASGPPELAKSAMDAISQWEYKPTLFNGKPAFVIGRVSVDYRLSSGVAV